MFDKRVTAETRDTVREGRYEVHRFAVWRAGRRAAAGDAGVHGDARPVAQLRLTVADPDGGTQLSDGPFAEIKEQLGGYYVLDCENIDEALQYAAKIPAAEIGSIEVRPVWEM